MGARGTETGEGFSPIGLFGEFDVATEAGVLALLFVGLVVVVVFDCCFKEPPLEEEEAAAMTDESKKRS